MRQTKKKGLFITLEGVDGSGKSTQAVRLACKLEASGHEVVRLREPGGTSLSEKIRGLLLDPSNVEMCPECELMLYEAARAQLVKQLIEPACRRGAIVICDRFFDSTYAYQAGGRRIAEDIVEKANELGSCATVPDVTILLDLPVELSYRRATADRADRMEAEGQQFQQRVRDSYLHLASLYPQRVHVVSASGKPDEVFSRICKTLSDMFSELGIVEEETDSDGCD